MRPKQELRDLAAGFIGDAEYTRNETSNMFQDLPRVTAALYVLAAAQEAVGHVIRGELIRETEWREVGRDQEVVRRVTPSGPSDAEVMEQWAIEQTQRRERGSARD